MSIFDPQGLYYHHTRSTKRGQIYQKRPVESTSSISSRDVPHAINVLNTFNYNVFPPQHTFYSGKSFYGTWSNYQSDQLQSFFIHPNIIRQQFSEELNDNLEAFYNELPMDRISSGELIITLSSYFISEQQRTLQSGHVTKRWRTYSIDQIDNWTKYHKMIFLNRKYVEVEKHYN